MNNYMKLSLATTLLLPILPVQQVAAQEQRPNVIVFLVDDMGLMDTSLPFLCDEAGNPVRYPLNDWYRTPNMERMARQGIRFSTFYAQSVSSPSRASILTGQNATRHGVTNWINSESNNRTPYGPQGWNWQGLSVADAPLPYVLQQAGYRTIHVGKAHFGCIGSEGEEAITMEQLGELSGRFNYELACCLNRRVPRVYKKDGKTVYTKDNFRDFS